MRFLRRLEKPKILEQKEVEWTQSFVAPTKTRPDSKKYGHNTIRERLGNSSNYKCFYSEVKFSDLSEAQVDHYIEVSEDRTKAFEWENLYLSHKDSNQGKSSNLTIPNSNCLDPFIDTDPVIEANLDFEDEIIRGLTEKGRLTVQKYNLNKPIYNTLRAKELKKFDKIARAIAFSGRVFDDDLRNILKSFADPDRPFSLMFKKLLIKQELYEE